MRIMNNVSALNAWRNLSVTDGNMGRNLERLSSGFRINRAADDVAGLAISENMRAQVRGLNQAVKNAQDGVSLLQTAEGSLNEVHSILQRMRELSLQAANGTLQPEDRTQIQTEMDNLAKEITRTTNATQFNSKDLIDGSLQKAGAAAAYNQGGVSDITLQIGPNDGQTVDFSVGAMDAKSLGIARDVMTAEVFSDDTLTAGVQMVTGGRIASGVAATGAVSAGVQEGVYRVVYDNAAQTVQLQTSAGVAIGTAVSTVDAGGAQLDKVTIGDKNTAQTIEIGLEDLSTLAAVTTDYINVGSRVASVDLNATYVVDNSVAGSTGVNSVGWGLTGTSYQVEVTGAAGSQTIQLLDSAGNAIGSAQTYTGAAATFTLGDQATGRTLSVNVRAALAGGSTYTEDITVNNNGEAAENAKFTGGVKYGKAAAFAGLNVSSADGAKASLTQIDAAIGAVSFQRSQLGAIQNRLEHTVNNLQVVSENLTASESRIRDVDMAMEMAQFTKAQILMQSGTAMLAQANQKNQAVLQLLR